MREDQDAERMPRDRAFTAAFALLATALACSIVVLYAPRPVLPSQLPALRLDAARVARQAEQEQALRASGQRLLPDPAREELTAAYLEEGLVELEPRVDQAQVQQQREQRSQLTRKVLASLGRQGFAAYRALLVEEAMRALYSEQAEARDSDRARGLLGGFPALLERYGYADAAGQLVAPPLSVRSFYKARLNLIFERPVTEGFSAIELQAYEGFHALHAGGLPPELRAQAAARFYRAGGQDGAEAFGIWLFHGGQLDDALALLGKAAATGHTLASRNMMLAVHHQALP
jgi:hypothetical protein